MTIDFASLIFIWLLPLTASTTLSSNIDLTTLVDSSSRPLLEVTTQSIMVAVTDDKTKKPSTKPPLQTTGITPSQKVLANDETAATPTSSISSQINSSTVGNEAMTEVTTSATTVGTTQGINPTTTTSVPSTQRTSTQSQDKGTTMTPQSTSDETIHPSTRPTLTTNISNATTSTKAVENNSTSPVPGGDAMQSTGVSKTSMATTKRPFIQITMAKKKENPKNKGKTKTETNHGKAVAGVIGGALILMMVGFLLIFLQKRKLQRQQISTNDWAGPSPFLDGGADNGEVTLRSSNRISFSSFLPQRLSKRLSLLPETDEELEDLTPRTTFGDKHQESSLGREVDGNDVQKRNGTAVVVQETNNPGGAPETAENSVSVSSSQTDDTQSTNNSLEVKPQ